MVSSRPFSSLACGCSNKVLTSDSQSDPIEVTTNQSRCTLESLKVMVTHS